MTYTNRKTEIGKGRETGKGKERGQEVGWEEDIEKVQGRFGKYWTDKIAYRTSECACVYEDNYLM